MELLCRNLKMGFIIYALLSMLILRLSHQLPCASHVSDTILSIITSSHPERCRTLFSQDQLRHTGAK